MCVLKAGALKALRAADCLVCVTSHLLATARSEAPAVKRTTYCKKISIPGRRSRFSEVTFPWFGSGRTGRIPSNRRDLDIDSVDKLDLESVSQPTCFLLLFLRPPLIIIDNDEEKKKKNLYFIVSPLWNPEWILCRDAMQPIFPTTSPKI